MSNDDILGVISLFILTVFLGFMIGMYSFSPNYSLSNEVTSKLKEDAKVNYRSEEKHIGYIISNYYKEVKPDGNNN